MSGSTTLGMFIPVNITFSIFKQVNYAVNAGGYMDYGLSLKSTLRNTFRRECLPIHPPGNGSGVKGASAKHLPP